MAERSFRNVVEQGFSLSSWVMLLQLYSRVQNTKSILISTNEIVQQLLHRELEEYHGIPPWIRMALSGVVQTRGLRHIGRVLKENELEQNTHLVLFLQELVDIGAEGTEN